MKKVAIAVVAAFMSMAFAGAYAADDTKATKSKGDAMKSDTGTAKSDMAKDKSKKKEEKK